MIGACRSFHETFKVTPAPVRLPGDALAAVLARGRRPG
jgi:hypothetical protein